MIILFPHKLGQLKKGVQYTPIFFREIIKNKKILVPCRNYPLRNNRNLFQNINNLYHYNQETPGRKINIGGDHSMSIATVADSLNRYQNKNLKVLWFDAHPDINTYDSSISKNYHGMPLGFLTGLCRDRKNFPFIKQKLLFSNLMYIGIRDIDPYEKKIIEKHNIKYITSNEINHRTRQSLKKIMNFIGNDPVHVSFDVDSMDPSIIPCTGTTYPGGLDLNVKIILDKLIEKNIVNLDITEINLELGTDKEKQKTIDNVLYLFGDYFVF